MSEPTSRTPRSDDDAVPALASGARDRLTLRFRDPDLERAFQNELGAASLVRSRRGLLQASVMWGAAAALMPLLNASALSRLEAFAFAAIVCNLLAWAALARGATALDRQQAVIGTANALATLCTLGLLVVADVSLFERYGAAAMMLTIVFGQLVVRWRFVAAVATPIPSVVAYSIAAWVRLEHAAFAMNAFLTWSTFFIVVASSYALEQSSREVFYQARVIAAQRAALEREVDKSDRLLLNVLPRAVAARLRERHGTLAESFESATVLFADIVGFTQLAGRVPAPELVAMLDALFSRFDDLAERHGLEKIKTIGDAYMVVGGAPERCDDHAVRVVAMGLGMLAATSEFAEGTKLPISLRVGVHSGELVAGVIGKKKFSYDLWGDTVNTASRMESHGVAGKVQISEATYALVRERFELSPRGAIEVKGKGEMRTWFLEGHAP